MDSWGLYLFLWVFFLTQVVHTLPSHSFASVVCEVVNCFGSKFVPSWCRDLCCFVFVDCIIYSSSQCFSHLTDCTDVHHLYLCPAICSLPDGLLCQYPWIHEPLLPWVLVFWVFWDSVFLVRHQLLLAPNCYQLTLTPCLKHLMIFTLTSEHI